MVSSCIYRHCKVTVDAALLDICVYPVIKPGKMRKIAEVIRAWAGLPEIKS